MQKNALPILIVLSLFLLGCANQEDLRPKRDCPIEELLLSQSDYPLDTVLNDSRSPIAEKPSESAGGSANYDGDATSQLVARHFSVENAVKEFEKWQKITFNPDDVVGSWETPSILSLDNLSADNYEIACGNVIGFGKRCYMVGQYEEYFAFFFADISDNGLTYEIYRDLVLRIDNEMKACINQ